MKIAEIEALVNEMSQYNLGEHPLLNMRVLRLKEIIQILTNELSIALITDKGVGKTSIINYLLGLYYVREKKLKSGKKIRVFQEVLETGAGATTTAESEICQSQTEWCEIEIEPYEIEEMEELMGDFAGYIFKRVYSQFKDDSPVPPELVRAIRNMTNLKETRDENNVLVDKAEKLALTYALNEYEEFKRDIIERARLYDRTQSNFKIDTEGDVKQNIRKIYRSINLMNNEKIPLPKKVVIKLSDAIFDFTKLGGIKKIYDTRGLESNVVGTDRSDILKIFREKKETMVLLVDKFNFPSQNIMRLADSYMDVLDTEIVNRVGYIVNFRDGEPENVVTEDGKIGVEVKGIESKRKAITNYFIDNNISIKLENVIFTNPKRFFDKDGRILVNEDDIDDYGNVEEARKEKNIIREVKRSDLCEEISQLSNGYKELLLHEANDIRNEFLELRKNRYESMDIDFKAVIDDVKEFDVKLSEKDSKVVDIFSEYVRTNHHSTLRAINNRRGIYNDRDIFLAGSSKTQIYLIDSIKKLTKMVIGTLENAASESDKELIKLINNTIRRYYLKYIDSVNKYIYDELRNNIFNEKDHEYWQMVIDRWGKGNGYTREIDNYYKHQLVKMDFVGFFNNAAEDWFLTFKKGLIDILEENIN